jgi:hypothetical protein
VSFSPPSPWFLSQFWGVDADKPEALDFEGEACKTLHLDAHGVAIMDTSHYIRGAGKCIKRGSNECNEENNEDYFSIIETSHTLS